MKKNSIYYHPIVYFKSKYPKTRSWMRVIVPLKCETKTEARALAREFIIEEKNHYNTFTNYLKFRAKVMTVRE